MGLIYKKLVKSVNRLQKTLPVGVIKNRKQT